VLLKAGQNEYGGRVSLADLKTYLSSQPSGPLADVDTVQSLLTDSWDELEGSDDGGENTVMSYGALEPVWVKGRMEHATWDDPYLRFGIAPHGDDLIVGSARAFEYSWEIDLEFGTAGLCDFYLRASASRRLIEIDGIVREFVDDINHGSSKQTYSSRGKLLSRGLVKEPGGTDWTSWPKWNQKWLIRFELPIPEEGNR
jgi:hypothetical protein